MNALVYLAIAGLAMVLLDRALLNAEARGWIYYRMKKASPGTQSSAAQAMQSLLEPDRGHAVRVMREQQREQDPEEE